MFSQFSIRSSSYHLKGKKMVETTENKHFICFRPKKHFSKRLICFPPAGTGASFYSKWHQRVPDDVEVWAAQLPQREYMADKKLSNSLRVVVGALAEEAKEITLQPFEFYGHSYGAALAVLVAQRLARLNRTPARMIVSARRPIQLPYTALLSQQSDTTLFRYLNTLGGINPALLDDKQALSKFMTLVRKDLSLNEQAQHEYSSPLRCPLEFVCADGDIAISPRESELWRQVTRRSFKFHLVEGDHFFVNDPVHPFYQKLFPKAEALETSKKVVLDEFFTC